jgi:hypothetical protein
VSLSNLINRPVTIIRRTESGTTDSYGNEVSDQTYITTLGEIQQRRREEPGSQGELSDTLWDGFFQADVTLDTSDALLVDGLGTFELVGGPWVAYNPRTQQQSHVEATLRQTTGAEDMQVLYPSSTVVRSTDSAARTSSTLADDDVLTFEADPVAAGVLLVEGFLVVSAANSTMDFKYAWSIPSGVTGYHGPLTGTSSNMGGWANVQAGSTPAALHSDLTSAVSLGSFAGITGVTIAALLFVASPGGDVTLQWAQNTTDAGDLILKKGSFLRVSKVG